MRRLQISALALGHWILCIMQAEGADHKHDESVTSVGFEVAGECQVRRLNKWLSNLMMTKGVDLFRSKGILAIQGSDDK